MLVSAGLTLVPAASAGRPVAAAVEFEASAVSADTGLAIGVGVSIVVGASAASAFSGTTAETSGALTAAAGSSKWIWVISRTKHSTAQISSSPTVVCKI